MGDKYYKAVQYLTKHPEKIKDAWNFPFTFSSGCLFNYAGDTKNSGIGCLTQIRKNEDGHVSVNAETPELTEEIRKDKRIPKNPKYIRVKHLPVFAEWQRRLDKELPSRQTE